MASKVNLREAFALRQQGETLAAIGARYGVTRERVRQLLPVPAAIAREVRRLKREVIARRAEEEDAAARLGPCVVCGEMTTRRRQKNNLCSAACGTVSRSTPWRYANIPGYKAQLQARTYLWRSRNPERAAAIQYKASKAWCARNPDKVNALRRAGYARRRERERLAAGEAP